MRKYKASEIIDRALHLADIANTDFLTHKEHIDYINDAWKNVYQFLISKGDKSFVEEVMLNGTNFNGVTEFDLPDDFYQIQSIREYQTNRQISRKADSESDASATYEVVNDKLRIYGTGGHLVMTYYKAPVYITFPDKDIDVDNVISSVKTSYKNSALIKYLDRDDDNYYLDNLVSGEKIHVYYPYDDEPYPKQLSDKGFAYNDGFYKFGASDGGYDLGGTVDTYFRTNLPNTFDVKIGDKYNVKVLGNTILFTSDNYIRAAYKASDGNTYFYTNNTLYDEDNNAVYTFDETANPVGITDNGIVFDNNKIITITAEGQILVNDTPVKGYLGAINYGYILSDRVVSAYDDTLFNFPNDFYVSVLSYELALKYAMKQNASTENLNTQLVHAQSLLGQALNADGKFKRITNVYR